MAHFRLRVAKLPPEALKNSDFSTGEARTHLRFWSILLRSCSGQEGVAHRAEDQVAQDEWIKVKKNPPILPSRVPNTDTETVQRGIEHYKTS